MPINPVLTGTIFQKFGKRFFGYTLFDIFGIRLIRGMKNIHVQKTDETATTSQSSKDQKHWVQLDLFEWAKLDDESCVGFAVRNGF